MCPLSADVLSFLSLSFSLSPSASTHWRYVRAAETEPLPGTDTSPTERRLLRHKAGPPPLLYSPPPPLLRGLGPLIYSGKAAQKKRGDGGGEGGSSREQTLVPSSSARWKRQRSAACATKEQLTHCVKSIYINYILHFDMLHIKLLQQCHNLSTHGWGKKW